MHIVVNHLGRIINFLLTYCLGFLSIKAIEVNLLDLERFVLNEIWLIWVFKILWSQVLIDLIIDLPGDIPSLHLKLLSREVISFLIVLHAYPLVLLMELLGYLIVQADS